MRYDVSRKSVFDVMSYSELSAVKTLFDDMGDEEVINVSREAERRGFTRSTAVNALKKLEIAGLISTRSLGSNGTLIKVMEDGLREELGSFGL